VAVIIDPDRVLVDSEPLLLDEARGLRIDFIAARGVAGGGLVAAPGTISEPVPFLSSFEMRQEPWDEWGCGARDLGHVSSKRMHYDERGSGRFRCHPFRSEICPTISTSCWQ